MNSRRTEIDVKLLLYAINKSFQFEELLGKRFSGSTLPEPNTPNTPNTPSTPKIVKEEIDLEAKTASSEAEEPFITSPFSNLIGAAFKVEMAINKKYEPQITLKFYFSPTWIFTRTASTEI